MHSRRLARFPNTVMFVETVHLSEEFLPQQPFQPPPRRGGLGWPSAGLARARVGSL